MKSKFTLILLTLIGQFFFLAVREVTSFNEEWLFKRGPFSKNPVKVAAQWNEKWETINLPHTWNAKDMQVNVASFYEGVCANTDYVWGLHNEVYQPHGYATGLTQALHNLAKTEDPDRYIVAVNGFGHAEHAVNQNADIQGMNRYFGWYKKKLQDIELWVKGFEEKYPWQKLMLTEYGVNANPKHQAEYIGDALNWGKTFYPESISQWKGADWYP